MITQLFQNIRVPTFGSGEKNFNRFNMLGILFDKFIEDFQIIFRFPVVTASPEHDLVFDLINDVIAFEKHLFRPGIVD